MINLSIVNSVFTSTGNAIKSILFNLSFAHLEVFLQADTVKMEQLDQRI